MLKIDQLALTHLNSNIFLRLQFFKNITMKNFLKFLRENKKGMIWFAVILVIAWITITVIENWNAVQEGFYEGLNG